MEQLGRLVLDIVTEASLDPSGEVPQPLLEVRLEPGCRSGGEGDWAPLTLLALHLPVLDGSPGQVLIQLHRLRAGLGRLLPGTEGHLVGSDGGLVGGGVLAEPEVDVLLHPGEGRWG